MHGPRGARLRDEASRSEGRVGDLEAQGPARLPAEDKIALGAYEARARAAPRAQQIARRAVDAVAAAFAPVEQRRRCQAEAFAQIGADEGVKREYIARPHESGL